MYSLGWTFMSHRVFTQMDIWRERKFSLHPRLLFCGMTWEHTNLLLKKELKKKNLYIFRTWDRKEDQGLQKQQSWLQQTAGPLQAIHWTSQWCSNSRVKETYVTVFERHLQKDSWLWPCEGWSCTGLQSTYTTREPNHPGPPSWHAPERYLKLA